MTSATSRSLPYTPITITTTDGFPLAAQRFDPPDGMRAQASTVISCATGVPAAFYKDFASWLAAQGVGVITYDYRWMGLSFPPPHTPAKFTSEARKQAILECPSDTRISTHWAKEDAAAAITYASDAWKGVPLTSLGHSLGGHIQMLYPAVHSKITRFLNVAGGNSYYQNYSDPESVLGGFEKQVIPYLESDRIFYGSRIGLGRDLPYGPGSEWIKWLYDVKWSLCTPETKTTIRELQQPYLFIGFEDDEFCQRGLVSPLMTQLGHASGPIKSLWINPEAKWPTWPECGHMKSFQRYYPDSLAELTRAETIWNVYLEWILRGVVDEDVGELQVWTASQSKGALLESQSSGDSKL